MNDRTSKSVCNEWVDKLYGKGNWKGGEEETPFKWCDVYVNGWIK